MSDLSLPPPWAAVHTLLHALHGDGIAELRVFAPGALQRKAKPKFVFLLDPTELAEAVAAFAKTPPDKPDIIVSLVPRKTKRAKGAGKLDNLAPLLALWGDIDREDAAARIAAFPLRPSAILKTGGPGRLRAFWLLDTPLPATEAKAALVSLARAIGADEENARPTDVFRLPGSLNRKYDPPAPVEIVELNETRRYALAEIMAATGNGTGAGKGAKRKTVARTAAEPAARAALPDDPRAALVALLLGDGKDLPAVYVPGHRDAVSYALAGVLVRNEIPPRAIVELLDELEAKSATADHPPESRRDKVARLLRAWKANDDKAVPDVPMLANAIDATGALLKPGDSNIADPAEREAKARRAARWDAIDRAREIGEKAGRWTDTFPCTLADALALFRKLVLVPNDDLLLLSMAVVVANRMDGDPVWLIIVAPSAGAKTEAVRSPRRAACVMEIDTLTGKTLISGYVSDDGQDCSLIFRFTHGGTITIKDFSTILNLHPNEQGEVLSQLRCLYDGHLSRAVGTRPGGAPVEWSGKVGVLAACVPGLDLYMHRMSLLGERFLLYRPPQEDRQALAKAALDADDGAVAKLRNRIAIAVARVLSHIEIPPLRSVKLSGEHRVRLAAVADLAATARTPVPRDGYSGCVLMAPESENPPRLVKQLRVLACALAVLRGRDAVTDEDIDLVAKVGMDSMPRLRADILRELRQGETNTAGLIVATGQPERTVQRACEDFQFLKLVESSKSDPDDEESWTLTDPCTTLLDAAGV